MKLDKIRSRSAFTLLEIMLVVMIIALLAGAAVTMMGDNFMIAGEAKMKGDIQTLKIGLTSYRSMNGDYPTTEQGLKALVTQPSSASKLRSWRQTMTDLPTDAWQQDYHYSYPGTRNPDAYDLFSAGKNKIPGDADDVGNWKVKD